MLSSIIHMTSWGKVVWRTDIKVENQINSPSFCSLSLTMAHARYRRGRHKMSLRDSPAIICLWRKFLAVFIELAYVVRHGDKNNFFVEMIFLLCTNTHPAKPPMSALPWGSKSHRVITHCKICMPLLSFAALKQTVPSLLLSVLKEIWALSLHTSCYLFQVVAVVNGPICQNSSSPSTVGAGRGSLPSSLNCSISLGISTPGQETQLQSLSLVFEI